MNEIRKDMEDVLSELSQVFEAIDSCEVEALVDAILRTEKVFIVGVGRVLLSMQAFVKRLWHIGIAAYYVGQIDEPAAASNDLLIVASNSGESMFPLVTAKKAYKLGIPIAYIGSNPESSIGQLATLSVTIPVASKLCSDVRIKSVQPMTSLFEQITLLLSDIIIMRLIQKKDQDLSKMWSTHANLE
jgi:6-phospho-3-hexuloisomerase